MRVSAGLWRGFPKSLSAAPFQADCLFGTDTELWGARAYLPPCMNAFVGADITCAVLASGMCQSPETALLCDLGTNGELALWSGGRLYVASTAAGPAFEGAGISCGSGLIDAVAAGLELGLIDETGAVERELRLTGSLSLTQGDIRAVRLAKAAIAAGIETLLEAAGLSPGAVEAVYLAGGFGRCRPNPSEPGGQGRAGFHCPAEHPCEPWGDPRFNERYVENMLFPEGESGAGL